MEEERRTCTQRQTDKRARETETERWGREGEEQTDSEEGESSGSWGKDTHRVMHRCASLIAFLSPFLRCPSSFLSLDFGVVVFLLPSDSMHHVQSPVHDATYFVGKRAA